MTRTRLNRGTAFNDLFRRIVLAQRPNKIGEWETDAFASVVPNAAGSLVATITGHAVVGMSGTRLTLVGNARAARSSGNRHSACGVSNGPAMKIGMNGAMSYVRGDLLEQARSRLRGKICAHPDQQTEVALDFQPAVDECEPEWISASHNLHIVSS